MNTGDVEIIEPAVVHRNTYRGKNLGTEFTDAQKKAIREGTFDDIYIGDYWVDGDKTWRVIDIDYWTGTQTSGGSIPHHLIVMPDEGLIISKFHSSDTAQIGYGNADIRNVCNTTCKTIFTNFFGADYLLTNEVNADFATATAFLTSGNFYTYCYVAANATYDIGVELPSATQIQGPYASKLWPLGNYLIFSGFRLNPELIKANKAYPCQEVVIGGNGNTRSAFVIKSKEDKSGKLLATVTVTTDCRIRPFALIKG